MIQNFLSWKDPTRREYRKTKSSQAFRSIATSKRIQRSKRVKGMKTRGSEEGHLFSKPGTWSSSSAVDVHLRYIPACKEVKPRHIPRGRKVWTQGCPSMYFRVKKKQECSKYHVQSWMPRPAIRVTPVQPASTSTEQHPGRETMNQPQPEQLLALTNGPTIKNLNRSFSSL